MIKYIISNENGEGLAGPIDKLEDLFDVIPPDGKEDQFFIYAHEDEKSVMLYEYSTAIPGWCHLPISEKTGLPYKKEKEEWVGFSKPHKECSGEGCDECFNGYVIRKCCMFCVSWVTKKCKYRAPEWCCNLHTLNEREHILYQLFTRKPKRTDLTALARRVYGYVNMNPIPEVQLQEAIKWGMKPRSELKIGNYYYGCCRNASAALWDGKRFWYMRTKFNNVFKESIVHPEDDEGYDVFCPLYIVIPESNEIIVKEYKK